MTSPRFTYLALHGFASSPSSRKNEHFAPRFAARGLELVRPDLNRPSFAKLSLTAMQDELWRAWDHGEQRPMRIVASSLGGYLAAWASATHPPGRIDRMLLLCPAFEVAQRWRERIAPADMARWERTGVLDFDDATKTPTPLHYGFVREAMTLPPTPHVRSETILVHGTRDTTVPIDVSRRYAREASKVRELIEVDDEHDLLASLDVIDGVIDRFLLEGER
jgi:pimeloyl-ACP methyl ester carboxylesterase